MSPSRGEAPPSNRHEPGLRLAPGGVGAALVIALCLASAALIVTGRAGAAEYVISCDDYSYPGDEVYSGTDAAKATARAQAAAGQNCRALAERLELIEVDVAQLADATTDPTQPAQRVALAAQDRNRLELTWWGVWATVGVLLAALVVPRLMARFRFWDER